MTFEEGDAQVHALAPGAFDVAISRFGVMFFADPVAAFANIGRALRPGGRLAFVCATAADGNEWLQAIAALRDLLPVGSSVRREARECSPWRTRTVPAK